MGGCHNLLMKLPWQYVVYSNLCYNGLVVKTDNSSLWSRAFKDVSQFYFVIFVIIIYIDHSK